MYKMTFHYLFNDIFQDMMQCIAYATADQYHLPTLCHDLIAHGFSEIKEFPRGQFIYITFFMFPSYCMLVRMRSVICCK